MSRGFFIGLLATAALLPAPALGKTKVDQLGDPLSGISRAAYGAPVRWLRLCRLNPSIFGRDCDRMLPGMVVHLPGGGSKDRGSPATRASDEQTGSGPRATGAGSKVPGETHSLKPAAKQGAHPANWLRNTADFSGPNAPKLTAREGSRMESMNDSPLLSGGTDPDAPASGNPGIRARLPDMLEQAASGHMLSISQTVGAGPGSVANAYSTREVGNSGWHTSVLRKGENTLAFTHQVPKLINGKGDVVGFLPDPDHVGQTVMVRKLDIDVGS